MFSRLGRDKRIIRRPNKSGDIYLSLFLTYTVFVKRTITLVLHIFICRTIIRHNIGVTPCIWSAHWRHYILAFDHSALLNGRAQTACGPVYINTRPVLHLRRLTMPAGDSPSAPVHNTRRRLSVRAGLQLPRPTLPSAPTYYAAADSSGCAVSEAAAVFVVRLSRPGLHQHTGPHLSA